MTMFNKGDRVMLSAAALEAGIQPRNVNRLGTVSGRGRLVSVIWDGTRNPGRLAARFLRSADEPLLQPPTCAGVTWVSRHPRKCKRPATHEDGLCWQHHKQARRRKSAAIVEDAAP